MSDVYESVAVIADIHGNAVALDAVLADLGSDPVDAIVVAGDVAAGPQPWETIQRLRSLPCARFVTGNADREIIEAVDQDVRFETVEDDPALSTAAWTAARLDADDIAFLRRFEPAVAVRVRELGEVLVCHGSPRSDTEIMSSLTPEPELVRLLSGISSRLVVCGHTHVQFDRTLESARVINAGSVGMPYEGEPGAYWLRLSPAITLRRTAYDLDRAVAAAKANDYWEAESFAEIIMNPPAAAEVEAFFEQVAAERGERPLSRSKA